MSQSEATPLLSASAAANLPVVLVLASGRGERFLASGGTGHKLQADLAGATVLQRTLAAVLASGLSWHLEDAGHPGMGDTIAAAVRATRHANGWLVMPADLPLVRPQTLVALAQTPMTSDVQVPWFKGQRGHPVRFSARCGGLLAALQGHQGAAALLTFFKAIQIAVDDPGCVMDIDTIEDLERATAYLQRSSQV